MKGQTEAAGETKIACPTTTLSTNPNVDWPRIGGEDPRRETSD